MAKPINEALAGLGLPVTHPPYIGNEPKYITYNLLGQMGQIYGEGKEAETGVYWALDYFAAALDGESHQADILAIKAAMEEADWIVVIQQEIYDPTDSRYHVAMTAYAVGELYG